MSQTDVYEFQKIMRINSLIVFHINNKNRHGQEGEVNFTLGEKNEFQNVLFEHLHQELFFCCIERQKGLR